MTEATIRWQAQRIEQLEAELQAARDELRAERDDDQIAIMQVRLRLQPRSARILSLLYAANGFVSKDRLCMYLWPNGADEPADTSVNIAQHICRLRAQLGHDTIETAFGMGFALTDKGRAMIDGLLKRKGRVA